MAHGAIATLLAEASPAAGKSRHMRKALGLVIPLGMEMFDIFAQGSPQGALAKEDHLGRALLLHRPDPALCIGIQVRAARGQHERLVLLFVPTRIEETNALR